MTLFHYAHGAFSITGWGVIWTLILASVMSADVHVRK